MMRRILSALIVSATLTASVHAQTTMPPSPDREITSLGEDLYLVRDGRQYSVFLVTPGGIILGDPLSNATARWLKEEFESRFPGVPIRYVLVTHHHYARAEGLAVFASGSESIAHERYNDALNHARDEFDADLASLDRDHSGAIDEREWANSADRAALVARDRNDDRRVTPKELYLRVSNVKRHFDRRWQTVLSGRAVEMIHVGATESPEMSVILFPKEKIVLAAGIPPLSLERGFGTYTPRDAFAWARTVDQLAFDIMLTSDGRRLSHSDITAFHRYLSSLLTVVADGYEAGHSAAKLQSSAALDAYRNTPFYTGRNAQIAAAYADLRLTHVDLYGAAMGRMVWPNTAFCDDHSECDQTTRVEGALVGLRTTVSRLGLVGEVMFGSRQRESARGTSYSFEHLVHRDTRGSMMVSFGSTTPAFSIAALAGMSFTYADTSGLWVARGAVAPASGARSPIDSHVTQLGVTAGADIRVAMGRRMALVVPLRFTQNAKANGDAGMQLRDVQAGVGLSMRVGSHVRRPQ